MRAGFWGGFLVCLAAVVQPVFASVTVRTVLDRSSYAPGDTVTVALECAIASGYHLYGNPLGPGIGKPLSVTVSTTGAVRWFAGLKTAAKKYQPPIEDWVWAYEKSAIFFVRGVIAPDAQGTVIDTLQFSALICKQHCLPVDQELVIGIPVGATDSRVSFAAKASLQRALKQAEELELDHAGAETELFDDDGGVPSMDLGLTGLGLTTPPVAATPAVQEAWQFTAVEKEVTFTWWKAILLAFLAGLLLNLMPCVLPVLGIKILSLVQSVEGSHVSPLQRSLVFAAGMLTIFVLLATAAAFANFSWGEQFQRPEVLVGIVVAIFVFGLSFFDLFVITVPSGVSNLQKPRSGRRVLVDDFIKGIMTTILATPCSGPFLGATLAWALTQPPALIYTIFISLGSGMAAPYIVLSVWSGLLKMIPKPGQWMDDFKHFMAFVLFGFAVYLMTGLSRELLLATAVFILVLVAAIMLYTRIAPFGVSVQRRVTALVITALLAGGGGWFSFTGFKDFVGRADRVEVDESGKDLWRDFDEQALYAALMNGQHVIVDFTANWCMNCQFNKLTVYRTEQVSALIRDKKIVAMTADLTNPNPPAQRLQEMLGGRSVPFFAIFNTADPLRPQIMRDLVQKKSVVRALQELP